jgi:serine/threonine-protein kinase RsbW
MSDSRDPGAERFVVTFDRVFPADPSEIDPVVDSVMAIVAQMGCADGREHEIDLAVREALANAIKHGCKNDRSKHVQCTVGCDEQHGMLIVVRDSGEGFDPADVPSPLMGENLFRHHGRGIYLISQLMDEVRFERGGTEIHMRKRPSGPPPSESTS